MVYLLKSAEFRKLENDETEFFFSLKIGYTEDENTTIQTNKRLYSYFISNRSIELVHIIPNGTKKLEFELHERFRKFRWDDSNEWYIYDQSIVDYICNITPFTNKLIDSSRLTKIIDLLKKFVDNEIEEDYNYIEEIFNKIGDNIYDENYIIKYLIENEDYLDVEGINSYYNYLNNKCLSDNVESDKKIKDFVKRLDNISGYYNKIRIIAENKDNLNPDELRIASYLLSYNLFYYINVGGLYDIKIINGLSIKDFALLGRIRLRIQAELKEGDKISLIKAKSILENIYKEENYDKTPKASDLENYFEVKTCKFVEVQEDGTKKSVNGYKLVKKL